MKLFLDLGDLFTKVVAVGRGGDRRLRFPSAVAHRLLGDGDGQSRLVLDDAVELPREIGFDPKEHPRIRSYPGGAAFLADKVDREVPGARFAGWLAGKYGADRETLMTHPTADNIDALVHKALLACARGGDGSAELIFVVDVGTKAQAVARYAESRVADVDMDAWSFGARRPRRVHWSTTRHVLDAADCALARLPPHVAAGDGGSVMLVDVGYRRTKLSLVSREGCEHQQEVDGLGIEHCVQRILRDGQGLGLIGDELAVVAALEWSPRWIRVAGRRHGIRRILARARRAVEEDLARRVERTIVSHVEKGGKMCRVVVVMGGGASLVGEGVIGRLEGARLGLERTWVVTDRKFFLVEGARALSKRGTERR